MDSPEEPGDDVDQSIIYVGFGAVMHQFQVFELTLWQLKALKIKGGTTLDQASDEIEKWDATTLGQMMRGMRNQTHWPEGMVDELLGAVETRNYLAHHFLREYFVVAPSDEVRDQAAQKLVDVSNRLEELQERLEAHLKTLGVAMVDDLDDETLAALEALRPQTWLA